MMGIKKFDDLESLSFFAAETFVEIGNDSIEKNGRFTVALAGGSTPKMLYKLLASDKYKSKIDWSRTFFFFGDERNVAPDSDASNFKMANETLFQPLQISTENVFRWKTELGNAEEIAQDYQSTIKNFFKPTNTREKPPATADGSDFFDLMLLGMGDDAHTASLFPKTEALNETEKIAVANYVEKFDAYRLTLTFPVINNSKNVIFLVSGENKAGALNKVLYGEFQPEKFPAQNVKPENGNLWWLVDKAAAKLLDS